MHSDTSRRIIFFTAKHRDGGGDVTHTLKIAEYLQDHPITMIDHQEAIYPIVVVPTTDRDYVQNKIKNSGLQLLTFEEFKDSPKLIDKKHCYAIAAELCSDNFGHDYHHGIIKEIKDHYFYTYFPEYGRNDLHTANKFAYTLQSGFDPDLKEEAGVISNQYLLQSSQALHNNENSHAVLKQAFDTLDPTLKQFLAPKTQGFDEYLERRKHHGLTYQYSHDSDGSAVHGIKHVKCNDDTESSMEIKTTSADIFGLETAINYFFFEHLASCQGSEQSQDVICLGGKALDWRYGYNKHQTVSSKYHALRDMLPQLKEQGYTTVIYHDVQNNKKEVLYTAPNTGGKQEKTYRVLDFKSVPYETMLSLAILSDDLVGLTGDQSFVEAMSAGKLISYECRAHKSNFMKGYLKAVNQKTDNQDVRDLAKQLVRIPGRCAITEYDPDQLQALLSNKATRQELAQINRQLAQESNYYLANVKTFIEDCYKDYLEKKRRQEIQRIHKQELSQAILNFSDDRRENLSPENNYAELYHQFTTQYDAITENMLTSNLRSMPPVFQSVSHIVDSHTRNKIDSLFKMLREQQSQRLQEEKQKLQVSNQRELENYLSNTLNHFLEKNEQEDNLDQENQSSDDGNHVITTPQQNLISNITVHPHNHPNHQITNLSLTTNMPQPSLLGQKKLSAKLKLRGILSLGMMFTTGALFTGLTCAVDSYYAMGFLLVPLLVILTAFFFCRMGDEQNKEAYEAHHTTMTSKISTINSTTLKIETDYQINHNADDQTATDLHHYSQKQCT